MRSEIVHINRLNIETYDPDRVLDPAEQGKVALNCIMDFEKMLRRLPTGDNVQGFITPPSDNFTTPMRSSMSLKVFGVTSELTHQLRRIPKGPYAGHWAEVLLIDQPNARRQDLNPYIQVGTIYQTPDLTREHAEVVGGGVVLFENAPMVIHTYRDGKLKQTRANVVQNVNPTEQVVHDLPGRVREFIGVYPRVGEEL